MNAHVRTAIFSAPLRGRDMAVVAAFVVAAGLAGQAARLALAPSPQADSKSQARLGGGAIDTRELVFYPREAAADASIRAFRPDRGWTPLAPQAVPVAAAPVAQPPAIAPRRFASAPLPPPRPASLTARAAAPRMAALRHESRRTVLGLNLPRFVPTGDEILHGIGGLGASMGSSIGSVGSSLGRLMRISSR